MTPPDAQTAAQALSDLIDAIDNVEAFEDLEGGQNGYGAVVRACQAIGKPIPPNLAAWFKDHDVEEPEDEGSYDDEGESE